MKKFVFGVSALAMLNSYMVADNNVSKEMIDSLDKRVTELEQKTKKNRLAPIEDIDFLYELVINRDYKFKKNKNSYTYGKSISYSTFYDEIKDNDNNILPSEQTNLENYKLEALKEVLNLENNDTIAVINEAYQKLNYTDWDSDRIRFMTTVNYIDDLKDVVPSIGIMAFPSYKKYIPGRWNISNILRRIAIYASIGNSSDAKNGVYSGGINMEIQNGMGINVGLSTYNIDDDRESQLTFGITLSSDLFKTFWSK